jgi:hypothetical protein
VDVRHRCAVVAGPGAADHGCTTRQPARGRSGGRRARADLVISNSRFTAEPSALFTGVDAVIL